MRVVTSVTVFNDAVGQRMSFTYSEIDESTGRIIADNRRENRVITDADAKAHAVALNAFAQTFLDGDVL